MNILSDSSRFRMIVIVVGLLTTPCALTCQRCPDRGWTAGRWSKLAVMPCDIGTLSPTFALEAPNKRVALIIRQDKIFFRDDTGNISSREMLAYRPGDELLWAPDSKAVILSYCLGAAGPCKSVVSSTGGRDEPSVTEIVQERFASGHRDDSCFAGANVGALKWAHDSTEAVFVAQVELSPECATHHQGYFETFTVSLGESRIVAQSGMRASINKWKSIMGSSLLDGIRVVGEDTK